MAVIGNTMWLLGGTVEARGARLYWGLWVGGLGLTRELGLAAWPVVLPMGWGLRCPHVTYTHA